MIDSAASEMLTSHSAQYLVLRKYVPHGVDHVV